MWGTRHRTAGPALCLLLVATAAAPAGRGTDGGPEAGQRSGPAAKTGNGAGAARQDAGTTTRQDAARAVREVVEGFRAALRSGDSTAALALLHPRVRIFEGGHAETLDEYRSGHLASDMAFLGTVRTETLGDEVLVDATLALYLREYTARGRFRGREIDARGAETIVLVRGGDGAEEGWKIRHIHWSSR